MGRLLADVKFGVQNRHVSTSVANIMATLAKTLPSYAWLTALPQLISRICHVNPEVNTVTNHIITHVAEAYPQQVSATFWDVYTAAAPCVVRASYAVVSWCLAYSLAWLTALHIFSARTCCYSGRGVQSLSVAVECKTALTDVPRFQTVHTAVASRRSNVFCVVPHMQCFTGFYTDLAADDSPLQSSMSM